MNKENTEEVSSYALWQTKSFVHYPSSIEELKLSLKFAKEHHLKVAIKGSAMSFSSVCLADEGMLLIDLSKWNKIIAINKDSVQVQAGVKIIDIVKELILENKMLFALSGSIHNTVAGNIGSDINGKDSWHFGNFGNSIIQMKIMLSSGKIVSASREENKELFLATIAGLGLTGIILEAELKTQKIPSSNVKVTEQKVRSLDELIQYFINTDKETSHFTYAWLNPYSPKSKLGQGIVYSANFIPGKTITDQTIKRYEKRLSKKNIAGIPINFFWKLMRIFYTSKVHAIASSLKFLLQKEKYTFKQSYFDFQYPMINVFPEWNLYFHPHGFTEIQVLFPFDTFKEAFLTINKCCEKYNITPLMSAVRRHKQNDAYLSFALDGLSFTINYSRNPKFSNRNKSFEKELINYCLKYKGKIYLSKFPYVSEKKINEMFPYYKDFKLAKNAYDPINLFQSHAFK